MVRSLTCIALGSVLVGASSWWDNRQGDTLEEASLTAIKGQSEKKQTTDMSCEYATITIAGGEVLWRGCEGKPDGTTCVNRQNAGKPLEGFVPNGGFQYPGHKINGVVNCNTYIRHDGKCLNGGCQDYEISGVCADAEKDDVVPQATTDLPPGGG